jgi:hypothetical protein
MKACIMLYDLRPAIKKYLALSTDNFYNSFLLKEVEMIVKTK